MTLKHYTVAYTHSGVFHFDDVISTAFLKKIYKNLIIYRVNEVTQDMVNNKDAIIYDIGGGRYDHHQNNPKINDFGDTYCAFGLLWEDYGKYFLKEIGFKNIDDAFRQFKRLYVSKIDFGDNNGYTPGKSLNEQYTIKQFNPNWYELETIEDIENIKFNDAVIVADKILDNYLRHTYEIVELKEKSENLWNSAKRFYDGQVVLLEHNMKWSEFCYHSNVKIVITKNIRGGYTLSLVNRKCKIKNNEYVDYLHNSGFVAVSNTLERAKKAAYIILNQMI